VDGVDVEQVSRGASFGELALLYGQPRGATCLARTACRLWRVDRRAFRWALASNTAGQHRDALQALGRVGFLSDLDEDLLKRVADALTIVHFREGERIINKGDVGEVFYILKDGVALCTDIGLGDSRFADQTYGPGDFFGEQALLKNCPRGANITAEIPSVALCLSRDTFEKTLGPLQPLIDRATKKRVLMGVPIFANSQFQPSEMDRLVELITEVTFDRGQTIEEEGQLAKKNLYIVREGKFTIANEDGTRFNMTQGDYFGDKYVLSSEMAVSERTVTAAEKTTCGVLSKAAIESVIGDINRLGKSLPPAQPKAQKMAMDMVLEDLVKTSIISTGKFGKVWLVKHKKTGQALALKIMDKREIIRDYQVKGVIREKNLMASIHHPFIVDLLGTFQDDANLYMAINLVQGDELFSIIHPDDGEVDQGIPDDRSRFYAACILESLAQMHRQHIIYRHLKPENILIDPQGYAVICDLGHAKIVMNKTYTLCGTPEYLAPEILLQRGHDKGVDYWAFGVLIFEMLTGHSPFHVPETSQVRMFRQIVRVKYKFPSSGPSVTVAARDLIKRLIVKRPAGRFGCLRRADEDVRDHVWFKGISAGRLLRKELQVTWIPEARDALDASHLNSHQEDRGPSSAPALSKGQQDLFRDF